MEQLATVETVEDSFDRALLSPLDPRGARMAYLVEPHPAGGARMYEAVLEGEGEETELVFQNIPEGREVRDRVLRAQPRMPDDIQPVRINKQDTGSFPIMLVGVALDDEITDSYNLIQNEIVRPLQRVDGVASVSSQGLQEKEVLIELELTLLGFRLPGSHGREAFLNFLELLSETSFLKLAGRFCFEVTLAE